jgi:hypothetical protein
VLAHQGIISEASDVRPVRSIADLLADGALADSLRSFVNPAAVELAAVDRGTPNSLHGPAPGEPSPGPLGPHAPALLPRRSGLGATAHEDLGRFLAAEDRRPGPSRVAVDGPALAAGMGPGGDAWSRWGDAKDGRDQSDMARLASVLISRPWSDTSAPSAGPADRASGPATGLVNEDGAKDLFAGLRSRGSSAADRLPIFPGAGEGLAGIFDAAPIATATSTPSAAPVDPGRSAGSLGAEARGETVPAGEARSGSSTGPGVSATADAETLAELASRLALAAERLEQAAGRLTPRGPYPLAAAPRPFAGRVDA